MSARAAWRLEELGFRNVYRYTAGKADWAANLLPTEGRAVTGDRAGDLARREVPKRRPDERIGDVRRELRAGDARFCAVVNERNILVGSLSAEALEAADDVRVADVMFIGPVTKRPSDTRDSMVKFFARTDAKH